MENYTKRGETKRTLLISMKKYRMWQKKKKKKAWYHLEHRRRTDALITLSIPIIIDSQASGGVPMTWLGFLSDFARFAWLETRCCLIIVKWKVSDIKTKRTNYKKSANGHANRLRDALLVFPLLKWTDYTRPTSFSPIFKIDISFVEKSTIFVLLRDTKRGENNFQISRLSRIVEIYMVA